MLLPLLLACTASSSPDSGTSTGSSTGSSTDTSTMTADMVPLRVVTFNTGTTEGLGHDDGPDDGYTSAHAVISDSWYGDGLAWLPAVDAATAFFDATDPDIVFFQEIFWSGACVDIPADKHADFVCESWTEGDPTVAQDILGDDYQVACHQDKPDKCAAVHQRIGRFSGCDAGLCLDGLDGGQVPDCGSGSRVGRGVLEGDEPLTIVNIHGTSGATADDRACRVAQVEQVFEDLGDGQPAANGSRNIVGGDLNTDPGRWTEWDESAARWGDFVGQGKAFEWLTQVGPDAPAAYAGVADIDHVASDSWAGDCWIAGVDDGHDPVIDAVYFDHHPVVCDVVLR